MKPDDREKRAGMVKSEGRSHPAANHSGSTERPHPSAGRSGARERLHPASGSAKPVKRSRPSPEPRAPSARELALDVLTRVEQEQAYSNLLLNRTLEKHRPGKPEAALATELVYGTIQRKNTIDYFLDRFVAKGVHQLEPWVRNLLRLSFYQLRYLDRIPAHAAVSEAVNIAKRRGHAGISGMVNAVLRNVIRQQSSLTVPDTADAVTRIALEHSHPEWLVAVWARRFGETVAERICRANNEPPKASVRVNALRQTREDLLAELRREGFDARPSALSPAGIVVDGGGNMAHTRWYAEGRLSIQDESSMLVAETVDPKPGMDVLDCCAAPGGKTTHMAELMRDAGRVVACDVHEHKRKLIAQQADRLGLRSVETLTADARELPDRFAEASFDRILLDAPCSGLGVIRRKPDIKWAKRPEEIAGIAKLQYELLSGVGRLLKPGGVLVYSTCTMIEEENERIVERFLREFPRFERAPLPESLRMRLGEDAGCSSVTILPHRYGSDGFFIARLRKRSD